MESVLDAVPEGLSDLIRWDFRDTPERQLESFVDECRKLQDSQRDGETVGAWQAVLLIARVHDMVKTTLRAAIMGRFYLGRSIQRKIKDAIDFMLGINKPEFTSAHHLHIQRVLFAKNPVARSLPEETGGEKPNSAGEHPTTASSSKCVEVVIQIEPDWLLDSGASLCMTGNPTILEGLHDAFPVNISAPNNGMQWSDKCGRACGDVKLSGISVHHPLVRRLLFAKNPVSEETGGEKPSGLGRHYSTSLVPPTEEFVNNKAEEHAHSTSCVIVGKGNYARPHNGLAAASPEGVAACHVCCNSNALVDPPITPQEGRLICGGSDPASADNCSITASKTPEPTWYVASAAAHHMTGNLDLLNGYTPMSGDLIVHAANMGPMQVHGSGSVNTANIDLPDVWYVPGLDANLISTSQLAKLGYTITLGPYGCRISKDDEDETLVGKAHFTDDYLFELDFLKVPSAS